MVARSDGLTWIASTGEELVAFHGRCRKSDGSDRGHQDHRRKRRQHRESSRYMRWLVVRNGECIWDLERVVFPEELVWSGIFDGEDGRVGKEAI